MLLVPVKDGEKIERALKRYKKKFERTKTLRELRQRQQFTKPSISKRQARLKAAYVQAKKNAEL